MKSIALCSLLLTAPLCAPHVLAAEEPLIPSVEQQTAEDRSDASSSSKTPDITPGGSSVDNIDPDIQTQEAGQPSPFDYNPSEEISEDLSVSFPVDI